MSRINFLSNAIVPGTLSLFYWEVYNTPFRQIMAYNLKLLEENVASLDLFIKEISLIDKNEDEYKLIEFDIPSYNEIYNFPRHINLLAENNVPSGVYTKLRLRYDPENSSVRFADHSKRKCVGTSFLDFNIENDLVINTPDTNRLKLQFFLNNFDKSAVNNSISKKILNLFNLLW